MQNTTSDYKLEIAKDSIEVNAKIIIGNNVYTSQDVTNLVLEYTQSQEGFTLGNTLSQSLDLTLLNRGDIIYSTSQIKLEIGLKIGDKYEYIPMGVFNIDDVVKTDYTTKFTCYDNMIKFEKTFKTNLGDTLTLQQVVNELTRITGVEFIGSLPNYTVSKLEGFTCREVLSYVASICGGNAIITRDGKFTIKGLIEVEKSIDGHNIILNNFKTEELKYKVGQVSCQVNDTILTKGSLGTDSMELQFENPWVTESILNDIYNKVKSVEYLGYSMKWTGDLALDPYDIVSVTDAKNVTRKFPILSQKLTCTKGIISEIGAKGETKNKNSFSSGGSIKNKLNRVSIELAVINTALIDKANIKDLEAVSIRTQNLEAKTAKIEEAIIGVAHIEDLNAINANIEKLIAADATINNALIGKADITELNAVKGTINVLESDAANIKNLLAGNVSGESGQLIHLTASNVVIADAVIKDLIAANISVEDLKASTISTNKFRIVSDSGKMLISDNTIQISDNNRVRVQIGKDASNDYNMYVWDSAGKLMFDANGLKADGIKNKIIRDDMISDTANIDGAKLNISSLITEINKDTNTSVIKSTKVQIDSLNQTLDLAFNSLKTQADNTKSLTESHSTTIGVMQGQITTAINNTQIVKDGQTILLKDDYNRTVSLVDSINSTIGTHSTKINELTGSITSVDTKVNSVERDLEGTKSTVSSHSTSITDLSSKVSTQGASISQLQNQIALKVEQTDIAKAIDNINWGITNKVRNSAFLKGKESWNLSTNVTIDTEMTLDGHPSCKSSQTGLTADAWRGCINYNLPNNQTNFKAGDVITISCYYYVDDKSTFDYGLSLECKGKKDGATSESGMGYINISTNDLVENQWTKLTKTITLTENYNNVCIRAWVRRNGTAWFTNFTLVSGNKTGDWSPAPEDVDTSIANIETQIAATSNKVAIIETNLSSITQRVSSTESTLNSHTTQINAVDEKINSKVAEIKATTDTITSKVEIIESTTTTINGNITNLQSKVNTVESKITGTAIVNTISSTITGGTGSISTTQFVMDNNGLTIKNGALTIQNKAGTTVLNSDTNGNLIVTGTLKSQSGAQFVSMTSGGIDFQDWNKNEQMLRIGIAYFDSNRDMNGVNFALAKYGDFIRFSHVAKADLTNGWTSSDTQYNFFDCWSGDQTVGGVSYKKGINVYAPMYINNGLKLYSGTTHWAEILGAVSWNNGTGTVSNMLGLYGDNGAVLGYKSGESLQARLIVTEASHPGTGDNIISWGNYNFNGYTFHNANIVAKSLSVSGSKNCLQETKNYGSRLINAYETAEYYFGDLGFGKISEDGECLVYIEDIFSECINTDVEYHVFTQTYNGAIKTIERYKTYFIVKGDPGTKFSWELKAKRRGYENNRLDTEEIENQDGNKPELFSDGDFKVETSENDLMDLLTFNLEDLLMEG